MVKLYFRYGAMNSGKSTILIQVAHNYEERGMKVLLMKPGIDTKGDDKVVSRVGIERVVDHIILEEENVFEYYKQKVTNKIDCIIVDEAQFLKRKQVDELMQIVVNYNIPVICYGLRTDFMTNGFEGSTRLLEIAHSIEEIKSYIDFIKNMHPHIKESASAFWSHWLSYKNINKKRNKSNI